MAPALQLDAGEAQAIPGQNMGERAVERAEERLARLAVLRFGQIPTSRV